MNNNNRGHIFISHSSKDDEFVKELRIALEALNIVVWADSRELSSGKLSPEIIKAINASQHFIVVVSPDAVGSSWVRNEVREALKLEQEREDYKVIPVLISDTDKSFLGALFGDDEDDEPLAAIVANKSGGLLEAMPRILAALGERLPDDYQPIQEVEARPVEELILELNDPNVRLEEGKRLVTATATLSYEPADSRKPKVESRRFTFTAPLGPIEIDDLRWYLESYYIWPVGEFKKRAERIEEQLPKWGQDLYKAGLKASANQEALNAWNNAADSAERCFSVLVDSDLPDGASEEEQAVSNEAASVLLSLPWELLHDDRSYLFSGRKPVRVRRRLPNRVELDVAVTGLPIRILLVSPRPEDEHAGYIDHRVSARPLIEAVENLGELVSVTVLTPPTFSALEETLAQTADGGKPFDVVHFDGHGVYNPEHGLGGLCFEDPNDVHKLHGRRMAFVDAKAMAEMMRDHRIPLVFLEACETARTEDDPTASVAASLLKEGVTSVVAMSHSVLVETAKRFVQAFYRELAGGKRVGSAMLAGQRVLNRNTYRGKVMGAGELHLQDWFVPVLYQEKRDPQLSTVLTPQVIQQLQQKQRELSLGALPEAPPHKFIGRSRELLALERLLHDHPYAVVRGQGGAGKTALAIELARWLVRTGRYQRAAFVSMETYQDVRSVLDSLGHQLLPEGEGYSVAGYSSLKEALQPVQRALTDHPTIIVLDNLESVLPDATGKSPPEAAPVGELFDLCQELQDADPATRLIFTSREPLPEPFDNRKQERVLGALSEKDAIELVSSVMTQNGLTPKATDPGKTPDEITDLVEAANRHARALVLLAQEISVRGVQATTENMHTLMADLHSRYPDDREKSLYASVELSLRRLPSDVREQIQPLAVFHGGASLFVFHHALGIDPKDTSTISNIANALIEVGLAENMGDNHLRLDPALPPYLLGEMKEGEQEGMRERWAEGMTQLTGFLLQQAFRDARLAAHLTLLELPNLLAMLEWVQGRMAPEEVVSLASYMEILLAKLGRPRALAQVVRVREKASGELGEWSHARFLAGSGTIDRLLDGGDLQAAYATAQQLLQQSLAAGEDSYPGANYNTAWAHFKLGRVLRISGSAETALQPLAEAERRFQILADAGNTDAEGMASVAITERAGCLMALGRLDDAAEAYEDTIRRDEKRNAIRDVAVGKGNLGTVRIYQQRYDEALKAHVEARNIFESLGEPGHVAVAWHMIGVVHREAGQHDQAEQAYRQSLAIKVQQKNRSGEASSLGELGSLYYDMGRLEEAVTFYRQAADVYAELRDLAKEGIVRNNMADTLIKLGRYDEARRELHRAIECKKPYGHAAEPWTTWAILHDLEQATGDTQAAAQAREQAIGSYLAYRRDGGVSQSNRIQLCALVAQAIQQKDTTQAEQRLAQILGQDVDPRIKTMIAKLQAILNGDRNPALAEDPGLYYMDAVELQLLLEGLKEL